MPRPKKDKKIYKIFCENDEAMTSGQVADKAGVSRATAKKWIDELVKKGKVQQKRKVGNIAFYKRTERTSTNTSVTNNDTEKTVKR